MFSEHLFETLPHPVGMVTTGGEHNNQPTTTNPHTRPIRKDLPWLSHSIPATSS